MLWNNVQRLFIFTSETMWKWLFGGVKSDTGSMTRRSGISQFYGVLTRIAFTVNEKDSTI